ncbi:nucleoside 2-deoxyribosyltransferase [Methanolobus mangrovi]|uniref:Putative 2'-deoxynucleoside 5'-phosphate N-hydrolase 1 n=1 Tax=Methanolobus mangrovi TaxID=3072977 RepID=A0AA51YIL7_9EURY|nr:nucleoside 2-deoxyribosyltransferase [Methanolobus mangrovi]WMW21678.1 nucleoside 2-deoxyribosyltransferase [Methanolobus mangrovi]
MNIFLSASIRGGRDMLSTYIEMCNYLQENGHDVLSWHVADPELERTESLLTEQEIYIRDMEFLEKSHCVIAEVSTPSIGVGYEISSALQRGLSVLCLYTPQTNVSAMILGDKRITSKEYRNMDAMKGEIDSFLNSINKS